MSDKLRKALEDLMNFVTESKPAGVPDEDWEPELPFFCERILYNIAGKEDARSILIRFKAVLAAVHEHDPRWETLEVLTRDHDGMSIDKTHGAPGYRIILQRDKRFLPEKKLKAKEKRELLSEISDFLFHGLRDRKSADSQWLEKAKNALGKLKHDLEGEE